MHILYASMMLPYPPTFGKRMEIWTCLRALRAEGHRVTLLSFADAGQNDVDLGALSHVCEQIETVPITLLGQSGVKAYLGRLAALMRIDPYDAVRYRSTKFQQRLQNLLSGRHFDVVICGEVFMLQNMPASIVPVILKKDHIATTIFARHARYEHNPLKRVYGLIEYFKMSRWESDVCTRASAIMACSNLERSALERMCPGVPVTVAPNVVDLSEYTPGSVGEDCAVLYSGLLDWSPNCDAVMFFARSVLPHLRRMVPNVKFLVAGRSSSDALKRQLARFECVEFIGTVSDMRPVIRRAAVCVVPLRIGSGTRFKILESGAMERPSVSTRIGAEGLNFADGTEIMLADAPETFARSVAALLLDPERRKRMGKAARHRVEQEYSFEALCRSLRETLSLITASGAAERVAHIV